MRQKIKCEKTGGKKIVSATAEYTGERELIL
jgi:hypothetical protein